jgi:hypothetical protein
VNAMHVAASVYINDDERGHLSDYEKWLEDLGPHAPTPPVPVQRPSVGALLALLILREPDRASGEVEVEAWPVCEVRFMFWMVGKSPDSWMRFSGTVGLSAVGLFGEGGGWGKSVTDYTLNTILGGVAEKPAMADERLEIRELLSVADGSDHDIIDGAPEVPVTQRFKEMIESGYGLDDLGL